MRLYAAYSAAREARRAVTLTNRAFRGWAVTISADPAVAPVYSHRGQSVDITAPLDTASELEVVAARSVSAMLQSDGWQLQEQGAKAKNP